MNYTTPQITTIIPKYITQAQPLPTCSNILNGDNKVTKW